MRESVEQQTAPVRLARRQAPMARGSVGSVAGVLALQRSAGNRATRTLIARCSGGVCHCGGRCKQDEPLEDPLLGRHAKH
jgi:hypothetical protein